MKTIREFSGGPYGGEWRACDEESMSMVVPVVLSCGSTLNPPRFAHYRLSRDGAMVFVGDGSFKECFSMMFTREVPT